MFYTTSSINCVCLSLHFSFVYYLYTCVCACHTCLKREIVVYSISNYEVYSRLIIIVYLESAAGSWQLSGYYYYYYYFMFGNLLVCQGGEKLT